MICSHCKNETDKWVLDRDKKITCMDCFDVYCRDVVEKDMKEPVADDDGLYFNV